MFCVEPATTRQKARTMSCARKSIMKEALLPALVAFNTLDTATRTVRMLTRMMIPVKPSEMRCE
jgi:hypothetical protein